MASLLKFARLTPRICLPSKKVPMKQYIKIATISTSKKSKDTVTISDSLGEHVKSDSQSAPKEPKNWINYGFDKNNIVDDNTYMHVIFFATVTVCLVGVGFIIMYQPDNRMVDWYKREAFLELRRRESLGLPLVDKDLVPAENLNLPSDEELGDIKIII